MSVAASVLAVLSGCKEILGLDLEFVGGGGGGGEGAGTGVATGGHGGGGAASTGGAGGAQGGGGGGGEGACPPVAIGEASDSFDDGTEDGWCRLVDNHPNDQITVEGQGVTIQTTTSQWYSLNPWDPNYGPFFYRQIASTEGDFAVVSRLEVTGEMYEFHGGGLMVRRPNATPGSNENYVILSLGEVGSGQGAAWFSTVDGMTDGLGGGETLSTTFEALAICRYESAFYFFAYDGAEDSWEAISAEGPLSTEHAQLSAASILEVGVAAHAPGIESLVDVHARYINFYPVSSDCLTALPPNPSTLQ